MRLRKEPETWEEKAARQQGSYCRKCGGKMGPGKTRITHGYSAKTGLPVRSYANVWYCWTCGDTPWWSGSWMTYDEPLP